MSRPRDWVDGLLGELLLFAKSPLGKIAIAATRGYHLWRLDRERMRFLTLLKERARVHESRR